MSGLVACPDCSRPGETFESLRHVHTSQGPHRWEQVFEGCKTCGGSHEISAERLSRIERGRAIRHLRVHTLGLGVRLASDGLDISPIMLGAIERGESAPSLNLIERVESVLRGLAA